ncbi:hypothetical protein N9N10_00380 [Luminiphilus sp.]|nr:hypothetical protein [Luminiphilus sp.]
MIKIESKIGNLRPRYLSKFHSLVTSVTQFGGGAEEDRFITGKTFSSAYEFYIYCFFLGMASGERYTVVEEDEMQSFWELVNWKPKELRDQLISCAIAKSDFDMFATQFMDDEEVQQEVRKLRDVMEAYANCGMELVAQAYVEDPSCYEDDHFFLKKLAEISKKPKSS